MSQSDLDSILRIAIKHHPSQKHKDLKNFSTQASFRRLSTGFEPHAFDLKENKRLRPTLTKDIGLKKISLKLFQYHHHNNCFTFIRKHFDYWTVSVETSPICLNLPTCTSINVVKHM